MNTLVMSLSLISPFLSVQRFAVEHFWHKEEVFPYDLLVKRVRGEFAAYANKLPRTSSPSNGVDLKLEVITRKKAIRLKWYLAYSGKRQPLIVLRPNLTSILTGQTELIFASGNGRETVHAKICTTPGIIAVPFSKKAFITVKEDTVGSGVIGIAKKPFLNLLQKHSTSRKAGEDTLVLLVRMIHRPSARGLGLNLDAWTGEVKSNVVMIKLNRRKEFP